MHPGLAGLIGRPDLGTGNVRPASGIDAPRGGSDQPAFAGSAGADVTIGRIGLGQLGLLVIGLGAFYFWTRTHQS